MGKLVITNRFGGVLPYATPNKWGRRPTYLPPRRMEARRAPFEIVLEDTLSAIPYQDWRLLMSLSRQLILSDGLLKGALEDKAMGVTGDAFDPEFHGSNEEWGEKAKEYLCNEWFPSCDVRGILGFKDFQFQKSTEMDASGDVFRILTTKRNGEAAIQLVRAHRIGQRQAGDLLKSGDYAGYTIENGIIMAPETGEVVAYNLLADGEDRQIPKGACDHLIDPIFSDQIRGLPAAISGLKSLLSIQRTNELDEDFCEMIARIFMTGKTASGTAAPDFLGGDQEDSDGNVPRMFELAEGLVKLFQSGTDEGLEAFSPGDRPTGAFAEFEKRRHRMVCVGMSWPYELYDYSSLTSVGVHAVEQKAKRTIRDRQSKIIPSAIEEIRWAIAHAIEAGILPFDTDWRAWGVTLPPEYSLNPTKAAESRRRDLELGLTTRARIMRAEGVQGSYRVLARELANEAADRYEVANEIEEKRGYRPAPSELGNAPKAGAPPPPPEQKPDETKPKEKEDK